MNEWKTVSMDIKIDQDNNQGCRFHNDCRQLKQTNKYGGYNNSSPYPATGKVGTM